MNTMLNNIVKSLYPSWNIEITISSRLEDLGGMIVLFRDQCQVVINEDTVFEEQIDGLKYALTLVKKNGLASGVFAWNRHMNY